MPDRPGPARLLNMTEGRSKVVSKDWFAAYPYAWVKAVEAVAMDGFSGFKIAAVEEFPKATTEIDPFHGIWRAAHTLEHCRRRVQQRLHGRPRSSGDLLYTAGRTLP